MRSTEYGYGAVKFFAFLICFLAFSVGVKGGFDSYDLRIGNLESQSSYALTPPYFFAIMDAGGFSDAIYYGRSVEHPRIYHEVLSGEWGAAVYYDGLDTEQIDPDLPPRKAAWLTKMFEFPYWYTATNFQTDGLCNSQENTTNPVPHYDEGQSVIYNDEVEIQIDYEVVDLEFHDPNYYLCRSPLGFLEPDANDVNLLRSAYSLSDRYVFLQTYRITNITNETLHHVAFYQMLHSHGADEYGGYVSSTYSPISYEDPLEFYEPYNPVHCPPDSNTVGNCRFDITQWNDYPCQGGSTWVTHKDWISFSCAIEPDWIDTDVYRGGHDYGLFKPRQGTHIHIENRSLNNRNHLFKDEVAGAVGWNLGSLAPEETVKRTVAFMFSYGGKTPVRHHLYVTQSDDVTGCFDPTDPDATITFTINYGNADPNGYAQDNLVLTAYLPEGTNPVEVQMSGGGVYDPIANTAAWTVGTLSAGNSGQETVTIKLCDYESGKAIESKAVLKNAINLAEYHLSTPLCAELLGSIVYVDKFAPGVEEGSNWQNAFRDLQTALDRIRDCSTCDAGSMELWLADGTYKPGVSDADCFEIPAGLKIYGGFGGWRVNETSIAQRNWKKHRTVLSGTILSFPDGYGGEVVYRNNTVVKLGNNSLLDGVTVEGGREYGLYGNGNDFSVVNCLVSNHERIGVYCENGNLSMESCEFYGNGRHGIRHYGIGKSLSIKKCKIYENQWDGIQTEYSTSTILNSLIYKNGSGSSYYGINLVNPSSGTLIRNNTIVQNINEGIRRTGGNVPTVLNNIVYYNNDYGLQLAGIAEAAAYYCCIQNCEEINNNINDEPGFAYTIQVDGYSEPNDVFFHLAYDSPCVDSGDSGGYTDEVDVDGEPRVYGSLVDIGADEAHACDMDLSEDDIFSPFDRNVDGLVNLYEFKALSMAWLSHSPSEPGVDPNDAVNWNASCNLDDTGDSQFVIDLGDLAQFCEVWLWTACWKQSQIELLDLMDGGGQQMLMDEPLSSQVATETVVEEKPLEEQILDMESCIEFLEKIWMEDLYLQQEIDAQSWQDFMDAVYQSLDDLKLESNR